MSKNYIIWIKGFRLRSGFSAMQIFGLSNSTNNSCYTYFLNFHSDSVF